jgi:UDP-N-acetylmuramoyl-tripeptide--D-alanyl-D-alanine ligase
MAEPLWSADEIVRAAGGRLAGEPFVASGVSIDTRSLAPGDLFVALIGERDGHEFAAEARASGAAATLASKPVDGPYVLVDDTFKALEALAVAARDRAPAALRGAVTGSVGKTSVTQAIAAGLALAGPSHHSVKSYNNHIGVPLTLARMRPATRRAVFEVGMNHADEITPLSRMIQPHAVAVTTVGPVHTEAFPDGEAGVARAKAEVFDGLAPGGLAVLNADNRWFDFLKTEAERVGVRTAAFGSDKACDAQLTGFTPAEDGALIEARLHGKALAFRLRQSGPHWGLNSLCVLLMLEALDVDLDTALASLAAFEPLEGRGAERRVAVADGAFILIDESYNANPVSVSAALRSLGARPTKGRRIVALTDMLELGPESPDFHAAIALAVEEARVDLVFCAGPLMRSLWDALPPTRRGGYAETAEQLAPQVARTVEAGDLVMVKGSKGSKAAAVAAALAGMTVDGPAARGGAG